MPEVDRLLSQHPFLAGMSEAHISKLHGCCRAALVTFQPGYQIFREGQEADACYLLESGDVALQVFTPGPGPARTIETLHGGHVLGWSWLYPPYRWSFDAAAITQVQAISLDAARLRRAKDDDVAFGYELMRRFGQIVVKRLQATRLQLLDVYASHT